MGFRYFILLLAQAADDGLQERVCVSSRLVDHYVLQVVEQSVALVADDGVGGTKVLGKRLHDHGQVGADERARLFLPQHRLEALLCLRLHLCVVILKKLAVGVDEVDEAGVGVPDRDALRARELFKLVNCFNAFLPIVGVATVNECFHLLHQLPVDWLRNRCRALVKSVLRAVEA